MSRGASYIVIGLVAFCLFSCSIFGLSNDQITDNLDYDKEVEVNLDGMLIVGVHPLNWVEAQAYEFWNRIVGDLHIQFIDRATGFMEGETWHSPYVNPSTVKLAHRNNIPIGSYMILTPIPPKVYPRPKWKYPNGEEGYVMDVCGGKDLNGKLVLHTDQSHATLSISCPYWLEHLSNSAYKILDKGVDAIDIDNIIDPPFVFGGDFSAWSVHRFKEYLKELGSQALSEHSIEEPEKFNITDYVKPKLKKIDSDLLVIAGPRVIFNPEEVKVIESFVKAGGGLLVQAECYPSEPASRLMKIFGISFTSSPILSSNYLWDKGSFKATRINRRHPATREVSSVTLNWGVALELHNPNATILIETDENTWIDINGNGLQDSSEPKGPFIVAAALEYGEGRIVVMGDRLRDKELLKGVLKWLSKGDTKGKVLLFDETKNEYATLSMERATLLEPKHPEWVYYKNLIDVGKELGIKLNRTNAPPRFPEDKILREYVKFLHKEYIYFIKNLTENVRNYGREKLRKQVPVYGNQWIGGDTLHFSENFAPYSVMISPYLDLIQVEGIPTLPPVNRNTLTYKFAHAMAEYHKPVWHLGSFYGYYWLEKGIDYTKVNLVKLDIAAAYANGVIKELDLGGWPGTCLAKYQPDCTLPWALVAGSVILPNMTILNGIEELMDFVWENRDILANYKPHSRVAVIYSLPSFIYEWFPALDRYPDNREIVGITDMLQRVNIPYDIIIFGHPELYDDSYQLSRLMSYQLVILPGVTHISEQQLSRLEEYLRDGGRLIITKNLPRYDEEHEILSSDAINRILRAYKEQIKYIPEAVGTKWYENLKSGYEHDEEYVNLLELFKNAINDLGYKPEVILLNIKGIVEVGILKKGGTITIHLINYNYNLETDRFETQQNVTLLIDSQLAGHVRDVQYVSPEGSLKIKTGIQGRYFRINIPRLNYWGIVVINRPIRYTLTKTVFTTPIRTTIKEKTIEKIFTKTLKIESVKRITETRPTIIEKITTITRQARAGNWETYLLIGVLIGIAIALISTMLYKRIAKHLRQ